MQPKPLKQPSQGEIQSLINLFHAGRLAETETLARRLLVSYPDTFIIHNVLGVALEGQRNYEAAATAYRDALKLDPSVAEIHFNLGVVLGRLGQSDASIACYRASIARKPDLTVAHYNLGIALQESGQLDQAVGCLRTAIAQQPGFFEAYGNLGTILKKQGRLAEAIELFRKALAIQPHPLGHFNLGAALRDEGKHDEAGKEYLKALAMDPDYADAHNNLGEIFRDQGRMDDAIKCYETALALNPDHPNANYNMAEFHTLSKRFGEAIPFFERSKFEDYRERTLECLYRTGQLDSFRDKMRELIRSGKKSIMLATLSTHHAINYGLEQEYNFCKDPMRFAWHSRIDALAEPGSQLLQDLLRDITHTEIAERKQGRLYYGIQSAGNLLKRPEPSFQKLAALVKQKIIEYKQRYAEEDCELIRSFPDEIEFSSSWYLKMNKGGHLTSHIHEEGWISGCVYLVLPRQKADITEGGFEYGTDGDDYPRQHDHFPSHIVVQEVGDIVLFPSSLFHRTIPFNSDEERVCVAFDLKPAA